MPKGKKTAKASAKTADAETVESGSRLAQKAAGVEFVKAYLTSTYGFTDPDTGQRRYYGPGSVEIPARLATVLGINPATGMNRAQARKAANAASGKRPGSATTTSRRASRAAKTSAEASDAVDAGTGTANASDASTSDAGADTAEAGDTGVSGSRSTGSGDTGSGT